MEKRILVPLDGTPEGEVVLGKLANLVFKDVPGLQAEVTLLKVIPVVNFDVLTTDKRAQLPYTESDQKRLDKAAYDYLEKVKAKVQAPGIKVKTLVKTGPAAEEIVKTAHDIDANLIAMSTHGRTGIVRWAIGSVAESVIKLEGSIPVLAIHTANKKENSQAMPLSSLQSLIKHT